MYKWTNTKTEEKRNLSRPKELGFSLKKEKKIIVRGAGMLHANIKEVTLREKKSYFFLKEK